MFRSVFRLKCLFHPRKFIREQFKMPLIRFVYNTSELYKKRTKAGINNVREVIFRGTIVALITAFLVWMSILMYLAFYYVYVPVISHQKPIHLQFKACDATKGICSFPSAHVELTKKQQLLMMGQPYKVHLELEMPESPVNKELGIYSYSVTHYLRNIQGYYILTNSILLLLTYSLYTKALLLTRMFMVCADFLDTEKNLIANSCRSTMLHYRGTLLDTIYKLVFSPFFILGRAEEKQLLHVELFSDYEEEVGEAVTDVYIQIQTKHIEIYSATFLINAQFSGLRYIMFHWPILSAAIGITSNLFFIAMVCMLSWYEIVHSEEYKEFMRKKEEIDQEDFDDDSTSSFEHASSADPVRSRGHKGQLNEREFFEEVDDN